MPIGMPICAEIYMLGYKAPRLEGMKSTGPLRCLLVKLNCTYIYLVICLFEVFIIIIVTIHNVSYEIIGESAILSFHEATPTTDSSAFLNGVVYLGTRWL